MIKQLTAWFRALSTREQWGVGMAAILVVLVAGWYGVARPLAEALADARARHADAVMRLEETSALLASLEQLQKRPPAPLLAPLESTVRERAAAAGFALANVAPQPNDTVQISIPSARPAALFGWVAELESAGVLVDTLSTSDNGDRTLLVQLSLRARGK